jgi:hypothetical protein
MFGLVRPGKRMPWPLSFFKRILLTTGILKNGIGRQSIIYQVMLPANRDSIHWAIYKAETYRKHRNHNKPVHSAVPKAGT